VVLNSLDSNDQLTINQLISIIFNTNCNGNIKTCNGDRNGVDKFCNGYWNSYKFVLLLEVYLRLQLRYLL